MTPENPTVRAALSGRLELMWMNKDQRLLHTDGNSYEWTDSADHRVSEVRLLHDVTTVGEVNTGKDRAKDNLLIRGDALHALTSLTRLPEFASEYLGKVKLVYIDPPFNTGQAFAQYDDALEHSVWLTMMRDRLVQIRDLLSEDGSVWVHLDDAEVHYCRVLMDEVFGRKNFVSAVHWLRKDTRANDARFFSANTDTIIVYARNIKAFHLNRAPRPEQMNAAYRNPDGDPRGPWLAAPLYAKSGSKTSPYTFLNGLTWSPPQGTFRRFADGRLAELDQNGRIYFGATGKTQPSYKQFLAEVKDGVVPTNNWHYEDVGSNRHSRLEQKALFPEATPFATAKPERFIERVLQLGSNPGDIVLDCFGGSGTTAAVAHKMGRRWVTAEREPETLASFMEPRLRKVVSGEDPGGVTGSQSWLGGSGFRVVEVAPSMFEFLDGQVYLADRAVAGDLAKAVAAQEGFGYAPDGVFAGRKNRTCLAVVDGLVNAAVVDVLVGVLEPGERVRVVGTQVDPLARDRVRELGRGTVKSVPQGVLASLRRQSALAEKIRESRATEDARRLAALAALPAD